MIILMISIMINFYVVLKENTKIERPKKLNQEIVIDLNKRHYNDSPELYSWRSYLGRSTISHYSPSSSSSSSS